MLPEPVLDDRALFGVIWVPPGPHLLQQVKRLNQFFSYIMRFPAVAALLFHEITVFVESSGPTFSKSLFFDNILITFPRVL